jgi:hypothetical protein
MDQKNLSACPSFEDGLDVGAVFFSFLSFFFFFCGIGSLNSGLRAY